MERIKRLSIQSYLLKFFLLAAATLFIAFAALWVGPLNLSFEELIRALFGDSSVDPITSQIILDIRLPRIIYALVIGGGLAIAGAVFQAVLLNPLAEPYILGISSGGTFGAVLSFMLGLTAFGTQFFAFSGSLLVILIVFVLSKRFGQMEPNVLLLSGVMVGAFFSAAILFLMTLLNDSLRTAVFWLIGNLSLARRENLLFVSLTVIIVSILLMYNSKKYNLLSLGDETAKQLGIDTDKLKIFTYLITSLMIGAIVSVSGIIGFVGLIIPHICRMIFGTDNRVIFPASFFIGASYLVIADTISRIIIAPSEMPVGAVTALLGAPVFIYLLRKRFRLII